MSKRLILFCAVALILGLAISADAAVQNVKVSGDLKISAIVRDQFDLGADSAGWDDNVIMSQTRVRVDADLTDNVSTTVRLINEKDWGTENQAANDTDIDIDLAYITLKEMLYSPLTLTIGRQEIQLGAGFVIGDPDTNRTVNTTTWGANLGPIANRDLSLRKSFDAIKATLDYDPLIIDVFYSKIDENTKVGTAQLEKDDIDLYGINAKYTLGDDWGTVIEGYLLYERDETTNAVAAGQDAGDTSTIWCPGLRAVTSPIEDLVLTGEIAWQGGTALINNANNQRARKREAMAAQVTATYALPFEKLEEYSPVIGGFYTYYSGDKNPADSTTNAGDYTAWDPLYENQGTGKIYNVLFDATNTHVLNLNASCVPIEDLTLRFDYTDLWLDKDLNVGRWGTSGANIFTLYGIDGNTTTPVVSEQHLGREFDITATYDYTEDVQFGLTGGWFIPGNTFHSDNDEIPTQVIGSCAVSF